MPILDPSFANTVVYFDFDNTVTDFDILDAVISRFAIGTAWEEAEEQWAKGLIGARDCLEIQMRSLRTTPEELSQFLKTIRLDPAFAKALAWLRQNKIEHAILSDNFSQIISEILVNNHITNVPIYANTMRFQGSQIEPSFPFYDETCPRCAHCKKIHLHEKPDAHIIYVGDGRSDICPALIADRVYAKSFLLTHLTSLGMTPIPFVHLSEVLEDMQLFWRQHDLLPAIS